MVCIAFTVTGKCVTLNTFLGITLNSLLKLDCVSKYLGTKFLSSTCMCISGDSSRYSFPGLSYTSWVIPSCCRAFSSKSCFWLWFNYIYISWLIFNF